MDTNTLAQIMQQCFPELGFSISDSYPGETAYDKLTMANGDPKPSLQEIEAKDTEFQQAVEKLEQRSQALKNKAAELGLING